MLKILLLILIVTSVKLCSQVKLNEITNISNSPINSFKDHCSRCHGYEGSAYGEGFGDMEDAELKKVVKEMMIGPAQLKPEQIEIEAMYSYNKSLRDNKPFAVILNSKSFIERKDDNLQINLSPETKLVMESNYGIRTEKKDNMVKLYYNPGKIKELKITITKNDNFSSFYFPENLWSE